MRIWWFGSGRSEVDDAGGCHQRAMCELAAVGEAWIQWFWAGQRCMGHNGQIHTKTSPGHDQTHSPQRPDCRHTTNQGNSKNCMCKAHVLIKQRSSSVIVDVETCPWPTSAAGSPGPLSPAHCPHPIRKQSRPSLMVNNTGNSADRLAACSPPLLPGPQVLYHQHIVHTLYANSHDLASW